MEFIISSKSKKPIYEQIVTQIKELILKGALKEGDSLPAIRSFAKSLRVSVITVQKAYEILQREGFIDSAVGRGTFVSSQDMEKVREACFQTIKVKLGEIVHESKINGISFDEMIDLLKNLYDKGAK